MFDFFGKRLYITRMHLKRGKVQLNKRADL